MSARRGTGLERGFTLVELMVALTIGLILLAGAMSLLISHKWTYRTTENQARIQENGRVAKDFLAWDLRMAGYFGCLDDVSKVVNHVNGATGGLLDGTTPLEGMDNIAAGGDTWYPTGSTAVPAGAVPGTDAVVIRYLDPDGSLTVETPYMVQPAAALHVATGNGLVDGDIVAVTDCDNADIFQITGPTDPDTSGTVNHNTGASEAPGNATKNFSKTYEGDATLVKLAAIVYYVGTGASGRPSLFRAGIPTTGDRSVMQPIELVEGVENLQILYGKDTTGDGVPDVFLQAGAAGMQTADNWASVVSVRFKLLVSHVDEYGTDADTKSYQLLDEAVPAPGDRRFRRVFGTAVNLRNYAG